MSKECRQGLTRLPLRRKTGEASIDFVSTAAALAVLTGCQSAMNKQRLAEADSGDLPNCARIREVSGGCGKNSGLTEVYVDNMHKNHAVQVTLRKHSQEGDDDTDYAVAEGGQLFVGCGGGGTSFAVVGCKVLKGEAEKK